MEKEQQSWIAVLLSEQPLVPHPNIVNCSRIEFDGIVIDTRDCLTKVVHVTGEETHPVAFCGSKTGLDF